MNVTKILINEFIDVILNILLFSFIPFGWYFIREKSSKGFLNSIGIYKPERINVSTIFVITAIYLVTLSTNILVIKFGYSGRTIPDIKGFTSLTFFLYLLLYGLKTGIAEEIFLEDLLQNNLLNSLDFQGEMLFRQ